VPLEFTPQFTPDSKVLFMDIPNYIRITSSAGMLVTDTLVRGATIVGREGQLAIEPFDDIKVEIELHAIDTISGKRAVFVRTYETIALPYVTINNVKSDSMMPSLDCLIGGKLVPRLEGYYLTMRVDSFRMETVQGGELFDLEAKGDGLTRPMRQVIYDVDRSIELLFYDIWVSFGTGFSIPAQNYRVYVTEDDPNPTSFGIGVVR
jgi:hypothetical protein